jgi:signal transduction histidine kinase
MMFIWFVYGLAFFTLGLVIIVYPKRSSAFKLANYIWLMAGFGILHGINEWLDMFINLGEKEIELEFSDTCGGIEQEMIQHIIKPFFTTEDGIRETGLGLAIAQRIVCAFGGKITAKSQPGKGTSFYVKLPIQKVI